MTGKTIRRISLAALSIGLLLLLTEQGGGPWAGTIIGLALLIVGGELSRKGWGN